MAKERRVRAVTINKSRRLAFKFAENPETGKNTLGLRAEHVSLTETPRFNSTEQWKSSLRRNLTLDGVQTATT